MLFTPLFKFCNGAPIHIAIVHVFAGHAPDEGIIAGACTCMYRPGRGDHGLVVLHQYVACFLWPSHGVAYRLPPGSLTVKIDLTAAIVRMRRHEGDRASCR